MRVAYGIDDKAWSFLPSEVLYLGSESDSEQGSAETTPTN